jgi:quinol monooxygenase YgiN
VLAAAVVGCAALFATRRVALEKPGPVPDFSPARSQAAVPDPALELRPEQGPVMVSIAYQIDPARAAEFGAVMQRTRRARLRQGALSWGLFRDTSDPGRYVEVFVDENWLEHQRRLERFTAFDAGLREERLAFHLGPEPPVLRRYVAEGEGDTP